MNNEHALFDDTFRDFATITFLWLAFFAYLLRRFYSSRTLRRILLGGEPSLAEKRVVRTMSSICIGSAVVGILAVKFG